MSTIARRGAALHACAASRAQADARGAGAASSFYDRATDELVGRRHPARPGRDRAGSRCEAPAADRPRCCTPARRPARPHAAPGRSTSSSIQAHDITFGIGPAGTGKTYLAVACAVDALERDAVKRIVLVRPAVEAGERLGFLPGDLAQKVDPYLRPLYDALYDLMGFDKVGRAASSAARSRSRRSPTCAGARSTTPSSSSTRRRTPRPSR